MPKPDAGSKKSAKKETPRPGDPSRVEEILQLQRRVLNRYVEITSRAAEKVAAGEFNLAEWATDYSRAWSASASDADSISALLREPTGGTTRKTEARPPQSVADSYRHWLALQQSLFGRVATYFNGIGGLAAGGSAEPRKWVEAGANFWSEVIGDVGDWIHLESQESLRPTEEWMPRLRRQLKQGRPQASFVEIDVPASALPDDAAAESDLLVHGFGGGPDEGLSRVGGGAGLKRRENLDFKPLKVSREHPSSQLKLFNLSALLLVDTVYAGLVSVRWPDGKRRPVAVVEVEIV